MTSLKRCYNITLSAGGDTWEIAMQQLRELFAEVEEHGPECKFVTGGYASGGYVKVEHDPSMTHAAYQVALEERRKNDG